jgi:serine/threonine-protein kinase RsbW
MAHPGVDARLEAVATEALSLVGAGASLVDVDADGFPSVAVSRGREREPQPNDRTLHVTAAGQVCRLRLEVTVSTPERTISSDRPLLQQFATLAAAALDDALSFERERAASIALQRSLLPSALPDVPGLAVAVRYLPSGDRSLVGGDWYDVLQLGETRTIVMVGDISGHGPQEASIMAAARVAFAAYALEALPPAAIVDKVDRLLALLAPTHLATAALAVIDLEARELTVVNAGHPPVIRIDRTGAAAVVGDRRPALLGVPEAMKQPTPQPIAIQPGDRLLLYTDGLIEAWERRSENGIAALLEAVEGFKGSADELCEHALSARGDDARTTDDICVLAVSLYPP